MIYIRKLFTQDLRDGKQIAFPKEPSYDFFKFDYQNKEAERYIEFTFESKDNKYQQFHGTKIKTRLYSAGSESRIDGELKAFIRDKLKIQIDDFLIIRTDSRNPNKFLFSIIPQTSPDYSLYLKITDSANHSLFEIEKDTVSTNIISHPHNRITFGAPGTGKSFQLNEDSKVFGTNFERVTFHPNYSYAQFVGTYKPIQDSSDEKQITYQYVPGPFMRIYAAAKQNPNNNYLLLIEEINRANVAAVFGDVFQLLDRNSDGESEYKVAASEDIKKYLAKKGIYEDELSIPSNMYIWATMNSADQGVFPMDTAFKRRWEFEYIGIDENENEVKEYWIPINGSQKVKWNNLRNAINKKLISMKINEDKLLGPFFLSGSVLENAMDDGEKFIKLFKSKVLMYLFEDAAKMKPAELFDVQERIFSEICNEFDEKGIKVFKLDTEVNVVDIEESNSVEEDSSSADSPEN